MPRYRDYYGLTGRPFGKSPHQNRPYHYGQLDELIDHFEVLLEDGGIGVLTGEVGIGKTTAMRTFLSKLDQGAFHVFYVGNSRHPRTILRALIESFGAKPPHLKADMLSAAGKLISRAFLERRVRTVCVIDEVHLIEDTFIEDLRLLTNFEIDSLDPLALILAGHPSLKARLRQPIHAALIDRLTVQYRLEGLSADETFHYIDEHMQQAGAQKGIFLPDAAHAIFDFAQGIPRRINHIALLCLLKGVAPKVNPITAEHVAHVISSLDINERKR
jgi:type II secretory pathway predicted ATPase ExeA